VINEGILKENEALIKQNKVLQQSMGHLNKKPGYSNEFIQEGIGEMEVKSRQSRMKSLFRRSKK
jgi:hypothetical protein